METTGNVGKFVEIQDQKIELGGVTLLHLNEIRKWAHFLSILGFVAVGLLVFAGVIMMVVTSIHSTFQYEPLGMLGPFIGIIYLALAVIYFFPVLYLYQFSKYAKQSLMQIGLSGSSTELMSQAIGYLKKHFRFIGILTISLLVAYILGIIGVVIAFALK
jgi:lysylphosphatidylglycerol synthetase-like protein (DUF2156 family)